MPSSNFWPCCGKGEAKMNDIAKPGQFVVDELGRIIVSYSSITTFRRCRRKYYWRIIRHLVPLLLKAGDPRNFGRAIHEALEALRDGRNVNDAIDDYYGDVYLPHEPGDSVMVFKDHEAFEWRERARAAMAGYRARWDDERQAQNHWEIEVLEGRFTGDITNPATGETHQRFSIGGKIDLGVTVLHDCLWGTSEIEPGLYLGETKTWGRIDGENLKRLWANFQILLYSFYMGDAMKETPKAVLYDLIGKSKSIGHIEAERQADFDQRVKEMRVKAQAGELGTRLRQKNAKGKPAETAEEFLARRVAAGLKQVEELEPIERETDESFRARLDKSYENPNMYHREVVPIDPRMIEEIRAEVWETLVQHEEAEGRDHWGKNETSCFDFNRSCDYWSICKSLDNETIIEENYRQATPHREQSENPHLPIVQDDLDPWGNEDEPGAGPEQRMG